MTQANTKKAPSPTYEVGYRKPPVHTRFRKGQSGNPSGRPKRKATERAKEIALQEAYRLVPVREGDRIVKMPAVQAVHRSQIALAAKGNGPAQRAVLLAPPQRSRELPEEKFAAGPSGFRALSYESERRDRQVARRWCPGCAPTLGAQIRWRLSSKSEPEHVPLP